MYSFKSTFIFYIKMMTTSSGVCTTMYVYMIIINYMYTQIYVKDSLVFGFTLTYIPWASHVEHLFIL